MRVARLSGMRRSSTPARYAALLCTVGVAILSCRERSPDTRAEPTVGDTAAVLEAPPPPSNPLPGLLTVTPVDEALRDPALVATRDSLLSIVSRRDTTALAVYLDPDVKYSFGENDGRAGLLAHWRQTASLEAMWAALYDVLSHGGRFTTSTSFSAPWTFTALPDSLDAFTHVIVRERSVPVYGAPADTGVPLGMVSHTVLVVRGAPEGAWWPVTLPSGREVYVDTVRVRSPIGYRVGLGFVQGRWLIQYFVAGD